MRKIKLSSAFERDVKREKRGRYKKIFDGELDDVIEALANDQPLAEKYKDHKLKYDLKNFSVCHIRGDLLLMYQKTDSGVKILRLERLGSHRQVLIIE